MTLMMKTTLTLLTAALLGPALVSAQPAKLEPKLPAYPGKETTMNAPKNLRCESQTNPLGIGGVPQLSWILNDARRGACQRAYQVLAASKADLLTEEMADV